MAIGSTTTPPTTDPTISAQSAWPLPRWAPRSPRRRQHCPSNLLTLPLIRDRTHCRHPPRAARRLSIARATDFLTLPLWSRGVLLRGQSFRSPHGSQGLLHPVRDHPSLGTFLMSHLLSARFRRNLSIGLLTGLGRSVGHTRARANREYLPNAAGCGRTATSRRYSGASGERHACPATSTSACTWWHCLARNPGRAGRAAARANAATTPGGDPPTARADAAHAGAGRGPAEPGVRHGPAEHSDADRRHLL